MPPLKILFVSPEVEPFVKAGGLGDMVGALPKELAALGHDVRLVCPLYGSVKRIGAWEPVAGPLGVEVDSQTRWARTWRTTLPGTAVPVYFIEHDEYFARPEVYSGAGDNDLRFVFFARAALAVCEQVGWTPDVIHGHDWTTGLIPVWLNTTLRGTALGRVATVFTIHNLEHQGLSDKRVLPYARLPWSEFNAQSLESYGGVNMMKAGLVHATKLTTVSPTYAEEIRTAESGCGLDHVLRSRAPDLIGILNGVDTVSWDPATDPALPAHYSAADLRGKAACKAALQEELELESAPGVPLFGVVARLAPQKGLDLLAEALPLIMQRMRVQFALLGSGDGPTEAAFARAVRRFPGRVGAHLGFDAGLARLIQAGSDFFVMPSRSEPCGLTQLYAMRYGTAPIVRATGGLADTVWNYAPGAEAGTGFVFGDATALALYDTIGWAAATYYERPQELDALRRRAMAQDFSWGRSAARYAEVYRWAVEARTATVAPA
ncbi:MAG: glycogen synthase GlgA [Opitutae bacterium]|nr:glycogen synthase GlgA [Opitutae bacterium]